MSRSKNRWLAGLLLALSACTRDTDHTRLLPTEPRGARANLTSNTVDVCVDPLGAAHTVPMGVDTVSNYLAQHPADYAADLIANKNATPGDGIHFRRISDALAAAKSGRTARGELTTASCRITITADAGVDSGSFSGSAIPTVETFPLVVDAPKITLRGGLTLGTDGNGRATATAVDESAATTFLPLTGMLNAPPQGVIVVTDRANGSRGDGIVIEGFAFRSGHATGEAAGGIGVIALSTGTLVVQGLVIHNNRFEALLTSALDLRATSAVVTHNYAGQFGASCGFCLAGPGTYDVEDNTILRGGTVGIFVTGVVLLPAPAGVPPYQLPQAATVTATIRNNDIRQHASGGPPNNFLIGTGIRVSPIGSGAPNVVTTNNVDVYGNTIADNAFAMIVDAGFPVNNTLVQGTVTVNTSANAMSRSCENTVLISFQRHTRALGLVVPPAANTGIMSNSTYALHSDGDFTLADVWYDNPAGQSNVLVVNDSSLSGTRHFYGNPCPVTPRAIIRTTGAANEGSSVAFDGIGSSGPNLSYSWTFGDGTVGTGMRPSHTYADNATYNVALTVTDGNGGQHTTQSTATIANVAPQLLSATLTPTATITSPASVSASFSDAGSGDTHSATINWGDGSAPTTGIVTEASGSGTVTGSHMYANAGVYHATVTVTDDDLASASATTNDVAVNSVVAPADMLLGLKNSDDVGTNFDLLVEVLKNGAVVSSGQLNGVSGGSSGINNAVHRIVNSTVTTAQHYGAGDVLGVRVSVRIATGPGHTSGTARLWYGDATANSRVTIVVNGTASTRYLRSDGTLQASAGTTRASVDVTVNRNVGGNPFVAFRTWSVQF